MYCLILLRYYRVSSVSALKQAGNQSSGSGRRTGDTRINLVKKWWQGPESNWRHKDFQSSALPTELPRHWGKFTKRHARGFFRDFSVGEKIAAELCLHSGTPAGIFFHPPLVDSEPSLTLSGFVLVANPVYLGFSSRLLPRFQRQRKNRS